MTENELRIDNKRPHVRLGIVGGDLRALQVEWPSWCEVTHFQSRHNSRGILNRLESALRAGKLDALIYLTRWNGAPTLAVVKKCAKCPVRYWDKGLNELKERLDTVVGDDVFYVAMQRQLKAEQEAAKTAKVADTDKLVAQANAYAEQVEKVAPPASSPPALAVVPASSPAAAAPKAEPLSADISKRSGWSTPEEEALILAFEQCGGSGKKLVENYRLLVPTSERTSNAVGSKLNALATAGRVVVTTELIAAVNRVDAQAKRLPQTEQSPRGQPGEWVLVEAAAAMSGRSTQWVEHHKTQGNIRSRRMPGYPVEYSSADVVRLARRQDAGQKTFKFTPPPDKVDLSAPAIAKASEPPAAAAPLSPSPPPSVVAAPPPVVIASPSPPPAATSVQYDELAALKARIRYILMGVEVGEKTLVEAAAQIAKLVQ